MTKPKGKKGKEPVRGKRSEREESAAGGGEKTAAVDVELGFSVQMTEADKLAEKLAGMREELEVKQTNIKTVLEDLQAAMHQEKRTFLKARAASGLVYAFSLETPGEKVVIKKASD